MGSSVASSVRDGPLAQENGGKSVREYSYRAPSDVSGGSANFYAQNLSVAMLHDMRRDIDRQNIVIAELKAQLANPTNDDKSIGEMRIGERDLAEEE